MAWARRNERWIFLTLVLISALPMIWPSVPPLLDAPGHIGQYRIFAEAGQEPLARHYLVHWALIGNLGVDSLVYALSPILGVELASHLIIGLIPPLTVASMLWAAREAHGRIPPAAGFALPLAYALPFQMGFLNFTLAAALALAALALWIRLARRTNDVVRVAVFIPIAGIIWVCHTFGWAMFGLFIVAAEFALRRERGEPIWRAVLLSGFTCAPMAWPQAVALLVGGSVSGDTGEWFHMSAKLQFLLTLLQERWKLYDVVSIAIIVTVIWSGVRSKSLSLVPILAIPATLTLFAFIVLPRIYMSGVFIDLRLLPSGLALMLLSIKVKTGAESAEPYLFWGGMGFFGVRTATTLIAFILFAQAHQAELKAVEVLPEGATVLTLVNQPLATQWMNPRIAHLAGIAVARKRIFTNEQWGATKGQQLIEQLHPRAGRFLQDPSQLVYPAGSGITPTNFDDAIATFDRGTFEYVWTIGFPLGRAHARDLTPIWSNQQSALYRVNPAHNGPLSSTAPRR
ncbi:hypothetical protein GCM10009087_14890 [Sphingomonas oligophenolica]